MRPPHPPPLNKTSSSPWMNESIDSRKLSGELRQVSSQFFMLKGFSDPWFRGFLNSQVFGKQILYALFQKFSNHDFIWCSRIPEYSDYIFLKKS